MGTVRDFLARGAAALGFGEDRPGSVGPPAESTAWSNVNNSDGEGSYSSDGNVSDAGRPRTGRRGAGTGRRRRNRADSDNSDEEGSTASGGRQRRQSDTWPTRALAAARRTLGFRDPQGVRYADMRRPRTDGTDSDSGDEDREDTARKAGKNDYRPGHRAHAKIKFPHPNLTYTDGRFVVEFCMVLSGQLNFGNNILNIFNDGMMDNDMLFQLTNPTRHITGKRENIQSLLQLRAKPHIFSAIIVAYEELSRICLRRPSIDELIRSDYTRRPFALFAAAHFLANRTRLQTGLDSQMRVSIEKGMMKSRADMKVGLRLAGLVY